MAGAKYIQVTIKDYAISHQKIALLPVVISVQSEVHKTIISDAFPYANLSNRGRQRWHVSERFACLRQ